MPSENNQIITEFLQKHWQPLLYNAIDISQLLKVSLEEAKLWVRMINGPGKDPRVTHHDLVELLKDLRTISSIPTSMEQLPKPSHWLMVRGWELNSQYAKYRWVDPESLISYTLRTALRIEVERLAEPEDANIIDVEVVDQPASS